MPEQAVASPVREHRRVTATVDCPHVDGGCGCEPAAEDLCAVCEDPYPCLPVRAFLAGRLSGLVDAVTVIRRVADRQETDTRGAAVNDAADQVAKLVEVARARLAGEPVTTTAPIGLFGVDPVVEPPFEAVAAHVATVIADRGGRGAKGKSG